MLVRPVKPDNTFGVGRDGFGRVHIGLLQVRLDPEEAINLAVWLITLADQSPNQVVTAETLSAVLDGR